MPGDGLDFDAPAFNSPFSFPPFTSVVVAEDDIDATGGVIPDFSFASPFIMHIDIPDGIDSFTLRQFPTVDPVPEPATALATAIGCLGLFLTLRRRI